MNGNELKEKISQLNSVAKTLNTRRQQDIGKKETLTKQIEEMIAQYNKAYGKNITIETVDAELEAVTKQKEDEVSKVAGIINAIQAGNFELANTLAGVQVEGKAAKADNAYVESIVAPQPLEGVQEQPEVPKTPVSQPEVPKTPVSQPEVPKVEPPVQPNVSPVSNPIDIDSGKTHNAGIFSRDFSKSEDDVPAPPVAPPSLADLL